MSVNGSLTLTGGKVQAASPVGVITLGAFAKFVMSGGEVANTDTVTAIATRICAVSANQLSDGVDGAQVNITGGKLSSIKGPALYLSNTSSVDTDVLISGTAMLISESTSALYFDSSTTTSGASCRVSIGEEAKLSGNAYIIEIGNSDRAESFLSINIDGGYFEYPSTSIPFAPNSSYITYPDGQVLAVNPVSQGEFAGYYTLAKTEDMTQIVGNQEWGYQYFDDLNTAITGAEAIYRQGNGQGKYDSVLWDAFANAYENAIPILSNRNANQNEINYFATQIGTTQAEMIANAESGVDISDLPDGDYTVDIEMWNATFTGLSMSNGAVKTSARLEIKNGVGTLTVDFQPIMQLGYWGSLIQFWVFDGDSPSAAKENINKGSAGDKTEMSYPSYQYVDFTQGTVTAIEGSPEEMPTLENEIRPAAVTIPLPYMGNSGDRNKIYCYLGVDMMRSLGVGDQPAILYIKYSTLEAVSVQATLSVDADEMSLLKAGTQSIGAKVAGDTGWTLSYQSGDTGIATVNDSGTVTAVAQGETTVTVTATKEGRDALTKTVNVKVAADGATAVEPEISGDTITISGDTIVTNSDAVDVADAIVIDASGSSSSGVTISFAPDTVAALRNSGKDVTIQTGTGNIKLDAALLQAMESAKNGQAVELGFDKISIPSFEEDSIDRGDFAAAYELTLTSQGGNIDFKNGAATVSVPWSSRYGYAYYVEDGELLDVYTMTVSNGMASWTTDHFSTWALSSKGNLMEQVGIQEGVYSVPIVIKQANQPSTDSMANDATGSMVVADVTDSGVTYTMFLKARVGTELGGEPLRGHLLKMWYYDPDDTDRENPISATVIRTYQDKDMYGEIDTFPREVEVWQEGDPQSQYYIMVSVDAMGADQYQDALVKLDWDNALDDGGEAAREGFEDEYATEQVIDSGDSVSRSDLKDWIDNECILLVQGRDSDLTAYFDTDALEDIYGQTSSSVKFVLEELKKSKLSDEQQEVAGDRPIYQLKITSGSKTITEIDDGNVEVTFPYELEEDEVKEGLLIQLVDDDGDVQKIKCSYSTKGETVSFDTTNFGIFVIGYDADQIWENPFTDVKEEDWFYEAVKYVVQKGLFAGTSETTFEPNLTMTRSMLVTVLYRLAGSPEVEGSSKFSDVAPIAYYTDAVICATQTRIVGGYDNGQFGTNDPVSREQMATILYRYAQHMEYDVSLVKGLNDYTDSNQVSSYAVRAMQWAVANGIINGTSSTTLSPQGSATRSQVAVILMRFDEEIAVPAEQQKEEGTKTK